MNTQQNSTASFTRIHGGVQDEVIVRHMDGTITIFGSGAAYEIFKRGLMSTNYTLYDEVHSRWAVGSVDQLDGWEEAEAFDVMPAPAEPEDVYATAYEERGGQ